MIDESLANIRRTFADVDFTVELNLADDTTLPYVKPYARSLINNLLHNAVKYRSYNRPLVIGIRVVKISETELLLEVSDNGIGMDLNRYGHLLFQPFKRLTAERPGTGIGLSIVKNAIERNGGRIEVQSQINKGATFKVYMQAYAQ